VRELKRLLNRKRFLRYKERKKKTRSSPAQEGDPFTAIIGEEKKNLCFTHCGTRREGGVGENNDRGKRAISLNEEENMGEKGFTLNRGGRGVSRGGERESAEERGL